jgi:hypothetical protein
MKSSSLTPLSAFAFVASALFVPPEWATISPSYTIRQALVSSRGEHVDLVIHAERPGDPIVRVQKRSLFRSSLAASGLDAAEIGDLFADELAAEGVSELETRRLLGGGFRVYEHFIDGLEGKAPFEDYENTTPSRYWTLVLPQNVQVVDTILQIEWFEDGLGGHAQLRFKVNAPLLLWPLNREEEPRFIDGDLIYALMALKTEHGSGWSAASGLTGNLATGYTFASTSHMAYTQTHRGYVEQHRLKLHPEQRQELFAHTLDEGTQARETQIYNLVYNSCINAVTRALAAVGAPVDAWHFNPYSLVSRLDASGLLDRSAPLASVNDEFVSPKRQLESPENAEALAMVRAYREWLESTAFEDASRLLARVIIEDQWTLAELNVAFGEMSALRRGDVTAAEAVARVRTALAGDDPNSPRAQRADRSVRRLVDGWFGIAVESGMEPEQLLRLLSNLNGAR